MGHSRPGPGLTVHRRKTTAQTVISWRPCPWKNCSTASTRSWRASETPGRTRPGHGAADHLPAPAPRLVPARIRHGRLVRLLLRAVIAALLSLLVLHLILGQPAGSAVVTSLITWFGLTARGDLAPPPGPVTKMMPPAGASGSVTGPPGQAAVRGWGGRPAGHLAVIPGQAEQTRPRPSRSFVQWGAPPGQARPGPRPWRAGRQRGDTPARPANARTRIKKTPGMEKGKGSK